MVHIVEVGPRDGLQNEDRVLDPQRRIAYIDAIVRAGLTRIEAVSFVRDDRVPQMAGAEEVMSGVPRDAGVSYIGLVMNRRGAERAIASGVDEINFVAIASETFSRRNQGMSIDESLRAYEDISRLVEPTGIRRTVTVAAAFGCPFEGDTPPSHVQDIVRRVADAGVDEIALADTIGVAVPAEVTSLVESVSTIVDVPRRLHLHNTRNTGYANALAGVVAGVEAIDSSTGGIGGCPFAPKATGNIATEDVLYQLSRSGYDVAGDFEAVVGIAHSITAELGKGRVDGQLAAAGWFPPRPVSH